MRLDEGGRSAPCDFDFPRSIDVHNNKKGRKASSWLGRIPLLHGDLHEHQGRRLDSPPGSHQQERALCLQGKYNRRFEMSSLHRIFLDRMFFYPFAHKVHMWLGYHSVCPVVGIGTPPPPPASLWVSPLGTKGGGSHSPACEGVGESQFGLLCTLCFCHSRFAYIIFCLYVKIRVFAYRAPSGLATMIQTQQLWRPTT